MNVAGDSPAPPLPTYVFSEVHGLDDEVLLERHEEEHLSATPRSARAPRRSAFPLAGAGDVEKIKRPPPAGRRLCHPAARHRGPVQAGAPGGRGEPRVRLNGQPTPTEKARRRSRRPPAALCTRTRTGGGRGGAPAEGAEAVGVSRAAGQALLQAQNSSVWQRSHRLSERRRVVRSSGEGEKK